MKHSVKIAFAVAALAAAVPASAAELVTNGGFELGPTSQPFQGWTHSGNPGFTSLTTTPANVFAGNRAASLGPIGSIGIMSQLLPTIANSAYIFSFALKTSSGTPNSFKAFFNNNEVFNFTNLNAAIPYVVYSFSANSTTAGTPIRFEFQQDPSFWYLDSVSVQGVRAAVPEPTSWALMLLGFGLVGYGLRGRRRQAIASFV